MKTARQYCRFWKNAKFLKCLRLTTFWQPWEVPVHFCLPHNVHTSPLLMTSSLINSSLIAMTQSQSRIGIIRMFAITDQYEIPRAQWNREITVSYFPNYSHLTFWSVFIYQNAFHNVKSTQDFEGYQLITARPSCHQLNSPAIYVISKHQHANKTKQSAISTHCAAFSFLQHKQSALTICHFVVVVQFVRLPKPASHDRVTSQHIIY